MPALIDDGAPGSLVLPDGRSIEFAIRYSTRTRSARLRVGAREGLVVVVPAGLQRERVNQLVTSKRDWIASKLADIEAVRKAGYSDGQIVEIIAVVAENFFTNLLNVVAETEIDFPVVHAAEAA